MTRNNSCNHVIDITSDILFSYVTINEKKIAFVRLFGFVNPTAGSRGVAGLRFIAYGPMAELIYAHVRRGSRVFTISHVQQRDVEGKTYTEFVIEDCQFLRNVDWEAGAQKRDELIQRGELVDFNKTHDDHAGGDYEGDSHVKV
ncbi:MAG TPA: hypothetical protein PKW33_00725 [Anaerolineaceae bacterium]|nr:hypothetical protein [Anaerolineaceae bacterium]HPN50081.1 hypothetical protein [Anaerolineaceae bacterium]